MKVRSILFGVMTMFLWSMFFYGWSLFLITYTRLFIACLAVGNWNVAIDPWKGSEPWFAACICFYYLVSLVYRQQIGEFVAKATPQYEHMHGVAKALLLGSWPLVVRMEDEARRKNGSPAG